MAEPSIELDATNEGASSPTYDLAIINGGTVDTTKVIRWGGPDSSDGSIDNVTRPASNDKWAEELWLEDTDGTDVLLVDNIDPDDATQAYMTFKLTSDAVAFATKPRVTGYDSDSHGANSEEVFDGSTNHTSPFIKARGQTTQNQPPQYWGEADSTTLHALDGSGGGAIAFGNQTGNEENCALEGDDDYLESSTTNINSVPQYFSLALSVPDDATTGADAIDCVLSIRYTYT